MFDSIREDPEFQKIVEDLEAKYLAEHNRIGQFLQDSDWLA